METGGTSPKQLLRPGTRLACLGFLLMRLARGAFGLSALLAAASCDDAEAPPPPRACAPLSTSCPAVLPSYTNEVAPIIATHCGQCHASPTGGPWPLTNPIDLADWSLQVDLDLGDCLMPPEDAEVPLSDADRDTLHLWLVCGAPLD